MGHQEKFELLKPWLNSIIETVKKDLKNEHLKIDKDFCRRNFLGKHFNHVSISELAEAYHRDIVQGNEGLGEFIASRWLLKNTDIYGYFEEKLKTISEDFDELDALPDDLSNRLLKGALEEYGPTKTYLFSILNSVVFTKEIYADLRQKAIEDSERMQKKAEAIRITESLEAMQKRHEREMAAMSNRYEKKLSGLQKKYVHDIEILKKQVLQLQKKLSA